MAVAAGIGAGGSGVALAAGSATFGAQLTSFGNGGLVTSQFAPDGDPNIVDVVTGSDGSIYALAEADDSQDHSELVIAKYSASGALDPSFGTGGYTILQLGQGTDPSSFDEPSGLTTLRPALALAPNGDVIAVSGVSDDNADDSEVAVVALNSAGQYDTRFASNGVLLEQPQATGAGTPESLASAVTVAANGDIVIGGSQLDASSDAEAFVQRLTPTGMPDASFGTANGTWSGQIGTSVTSDLLGLILDRSGDPVIAAETQLQSNSGSYEMGILRLSPSGVPDASFNPTLTAGPSGDSDGIPVGLVQLPDGDYVAAGAFVDATSGMDVFGAAAFGPSGGVDTTFASGGFYTDQLGTAATGDTPTSAAFSAEVQTDGKLVLVGDASYLAAGATSELEQAVVRLSETGSPDPSFGSSGIELTPLGPEGYNETFAATLTPGGQLLTSGQLVLDSSDTGAGYLDEEQLDIPPSVSLSASSTSPTTGQGVSLTATGTDADGSTPSYSWSIGGGNPSTASGANVSASFASAGSHTITVTATDADGLSAQASTTVNVVTPPPSPTTTTTSTSTPTPVPVTPVAVAKLVVVATKIVSSDVVEVKVKADNGTFRGTATLSVVEHFLKRKLVAVTAEASAEKTRESTKTVLIAQKTFTLKEGQSVTLKLKLNKTGLALLKKHKTLKAFLKTSGKSATRSSVSEKSVSIREPAAKKKVVKKK